MAGFDSAVTGGVDALNRTPLWIPAVAPLVGLTVAAMSLRMLGPRSSPATADEYLHAFHSPDHALGVRPLLSRMIAAIATLGSGAPMGLEGPSTYLGASLGDVLPRRFPRLFSVQNRRVLLVAGAAAGVAAILKAPATGAVFALEVPYQDDLARRMLGPALVASATGYLAFVAIHGTTHCSKSRAIPRSPSGTSRAPPCSACWRARARASSRGCCDGPRNSPAKSLRGCGCRPRASASPASSCSRVR